MSDTDKLETIVVGTDFSEDARAAFRWAIDIAHERGARIVLTHAAAIAMPFVPEVLPMDDRWYRAMEEGARAQLGSWAELARSKNVAVETVLEWEPAATSVLALAKNRRADLLIVGTRGLTGWRHLVLGSVAARIVRRACCPVVTVHAGTTPHRPVRTILLPTDLSDDAARAAEAATRVFGDAKDRRVVLLHVYRYPMVFSNAPAFVLTHEIADFVRDTRAQLGMLAERFRERGIAAEVIIEEGIPSQSILKHAGEMNVDLIAMGTHGRSGLDRLFLGSTAERVLPEAPCPVLTVHGLDAASSTGAR
jgi:nucleotide-binding universal stress UspA family protein